MGPVEVTGQGVGGLLSPRAPLDFGNSGTGSRLMLGVVAGHPIEARFTGDASLCRRPMGRVLQPLKLMGLAVGDDTRTTLPLTIRGTQDLVPIVYQSPIASAQVKSAVLLAGLHAPGRTTVIEPVPTRDHTERMLDVFRRRDLGEGRGRRPPAPSQSAATPNSAAPPSPFLVTRALPPSPSPRR